MRLRAWLCAALLAGGSCSGGLLAAEDDVMLRFSNADIESLVKLVSEISGRNFVLDPRVKGTFTIVSSRPVPKAQVYPLFLSALRLQGFAVVEAGGIARIVPEADAKLNAGASIEPGARASGERITTLVYPLQHESAAQVLPVLRPLIPPNNAIAVLPGSNTLLITDYADNINRLMKILQAVDRADSAEILVLELQHASAVEVAQVLVRLLPDAAPAAPIAGAPPPRPLVTPDPRSNSLFVRAITPAIAARATDLVARLDVPARSPGNVHVVPLRNAEAQKMAETLRALAASDAKAPAASAQAPSAPAASFIQADVATNSLIIAAPDPIYNSMRAVIDQLDSRRAQVYLEALIAEVTTDKAAELGIQFQALSAAAAATDATRAVGVTNFPVTPGSSIVGAARNITNVGPGLTVGVIRGRISLPGVGEVLNLGILARALESDAQTNILSTPNLLTLDNEEAKIVVGQNVPFITGSYAQAASSGASGAGVNPFQTIDRRDVGLTLRVRPQVAEGGSVKLRIYQEVSSVQDLTNPAGIITNKRSIESAVLVEDGEIIALGGLIQDDVRSNEDKVPLLGDLPIVGPLFRYDSRRRVKTNLMVFLRPVVLREPGAAASLTFDRYEYIRNQQAGAAVPPRPPLPDLPAPRLPELPAP